MNRYLWISVEFWREKADCQEAERVVREFAPKNFSFGCNELATDASSGAVIEPILNKMNYIYSPTLDWMSEGTPPGFPPCIGGSKKYSNTKMRISPSKLQLSPIYEQEPTPFTQEPLSVSLNLYCRFYCTHILLRAPTFYSIQFLDLFRSQLLPPITKFFSTLDSLYFLPSFKFSSLSASSTDHWPLTRPQ